MFVLILIFYYLFAIINTEDPCEKLNYLGDNIQNKALLSPVIIIGKPVANFGLAEPKFKMTIQIIKIVKGSLGKWKNQMIIAGGFSIFKDSKNFCQFQNSSKVEQIYFLQAISEDNGEYRVLFNPEISDNNQLDEINKTICEGCGKLPTISVKDLSKSNDFYVAECMGDGNPTPIVKWNVSKININTIIEPIKGGIRLIQPVNNLSNEVYVCEAVNLIGFTSYTINLKTILFKAPVLINRCASMDNQLCNGNGKCYEDRSEKDSKFCRCIKGFGGPNCINISKNLPDDLMQRKKEMDEKFCNNQGKVYENYKTKSQYCECNLNFFGDKCEQIYRLKDEWNVKKLIQEETSQLSVKYIIIGCLIVLAGCVIILIVIICLWKYYFKKNNKSHKPYKHEAEKSGNNIYNHMNQDNFIVPIPTNEKNRLSLTNIKPYSKKEKHIDNKEFGLEGQHLCPGNGIYDNP